VVGKNSYFPLFGIILGWPLIAKAGLDGRM